jgi:polar amino acid transport system substrate-binding protein
MNEYSGTIIKGRLLKFGAFFLLLNLSYLSHAQTIDSLILMSEQFPPYNFEQDNRVQGISIDLMALCLEKLGAEIGRKDIQILPWARAFNALLNDQNTVLFAITRTEERENLFKWVGPISSARNVLIAKKENKIIINSPEDLKQYHIGVVRNDAGEQLMEKKVWFSKEQLVINSYSRSSILQLDLGRIDLFAYDEVVVKWLLKEEGLDPDDFESVYLLEEGFHYFGFNINTPVLIIQQFQNVLDEIKESGEYDQIVSKYLN